MTLICKGSKVAFVMEGEENDPFYLPENFGMLHDPERERCVVYFAPYKRTRQPIEMTPAAKNYLGKDYPAVAATTGIDLPTVRWESIGRVVEINYERHGKYEGPFFHPFRIAKVALSASEDGRALRLDLGMFCLIDDRGFVFP